MTFQLYFAKEAVKDAKKIKQAGLAEKAKNLLDIMRENPYQNNPPYEKLVGRLKGTYSRRINIQHRLVYQVDEEERVIRVLRMWSHYE
ncbi:Txe/YoeB family addiction module toxin [Candidatus Finniella inopinata]|uniref:Putative mRNA interferase YoeB n=1 Tax=Candidatus Finniella inopinata TaxID=1696036 RepID=A0A4Q7DIM5_9PROT|nr:Txe/YoeB family addiction module toxin [Candidatus Finniella inopinata]RZI45955.1 Txe/YoeB family addiction module toxin [Candidatus Finniella inopinata]